MTNHEIAAVFEHVADLLEFQGANPFRVRAYRNAARTIHDLGQSAADMVAKDEQGLTEIAGIGKDLAEKVATLVRTGSLPMLDELLAETPERVLAILRVPGLGPKRAAQLYRELKVATLDELRAACESHKVQELKGFGAKIEAAILQGLEIASEAGRRILWIEADQHAQEILAHMRRCRAVAQIAAAGSYRRGKETVGDLDFIVVTGDVGAVMDHLAGFGGVALILARGETKMSLRLGAGVQVDLRAVAAESFGAALQYFTGSKEHNTKLRGLAQQHQMTLNEWGLYKLRDYDRSEKKPGFPPSAKPVAGKTEEEIYKALGMACMEPTLREDRGEIEAALAGKLPKIVQLQDIRGDLHTHTTASDGQATIEQMAEAAMERGYEFLAITDHSKTQVIANGLSAQRLMQHAAEIRRASDRMKGITLLAGCEVDILADGRLDFEDAVLAELDFVVASPHVALKQESGKATDRVLRAIENRYVNVIGHPTGRLIFDREGLPLNFPPIFKAATETGTALEINASFPRLDLNDVSAHGAVAAGVKLAIDTDAHSVDQLDQMQFGICVAQRAWATAADVINCLKVAKLKEFVARKRR
jgi:DNA polymerase (family 10)